MEPSNTGDTDTILTKKDSQSLEKRQRKRAEIVSKVDYKGITLKEYFRLCDQTISYQPMLPIQEEQRGDGKESGADTPAFGMKQSKVRKRQVFHTEVNQENESLLRMNVKKGWGAGDKIEKTLGMLQRSQGEKGERVRSINISLGENNGLFVGRKAHQRSKKVVSPWKVGDCFAKSSMGTFYYVKDRRQRMLEKVKAQKERLRGIGLNELFLVTKYASRFNIHAKEVIV